MMDNRTRQLLEQKQSLLRLARQELRAKEDEVKRQKQYIIEMERDLRTFESSAWRR